VFKGTVEFLTEINGNGLAFPIFDLDPNQQGVTKVEIEGPDGYKVRGTVHLGLVATEDEGRSLATKAITAVLDRIAFHYDMSIANTRIVQDQFSPLSPAPGLHVCKSRDTMTFSEILIPVLAVPAADLKAKLEKQSQPGERYFGLFRSALQSMSPVEKFMHLYHILLMLFNDEQAEVDKFIRGEDSGVPYELSGDPKLAKRGIKETIYSRLRNEFAHKRSNVSLEHTKFEMTNRLGGLIQLTKRAIELHP
jgi:hypothetical protein